MSTTPTTAVQLANNSLTANRQNLTVTKTAVQDVLARIGMIQRVMKSVMIDGTHYGNITGCGDKPVLLKPGAEVILATFNLAVNPRVEDLSTDDCFRYRVSCDIINTDGAVIGTGVGEASTNEEKYKWRDAVCETEFNETPENYRRVKYSKNSTFTRKQVRTNPADIANTVLKMAKKRSEIDGVLTATGASDCFTQDLEDNIQEYRKEAARVGKNESAAPAPSAPPESTKDKARKAFVKPPTPAEQPPTAPPIEPAPVNNEFFEPK